MSQEAVTSTPRIVPDLIRTHAAIIHGCARLLQVPAKLVIAGFGEDPVLIDPKTGKPGHRLRSRIIHLAVGDVDGIAEAVGQITKLPHYNVYMPLAAFSPDLAAGAKGGEQEVVACFGIVADFDDADAARWAERLPIPPQYVLETSAGRYQAFYLFDKPESVTAVKPVAERLKAFARCDHGTSDISHVWRIPGTLNWPNAKKVGEGRSPEPQQVKVVQQFDGKTIPLETLDAALPATVSTIKARERTDARVQASPSKPQQVNQPRRHRALQQGTREWLRAWFTMAMMSPDLQAEICQPAEGDRSKALYRVIAKLIEQGLPDDEIENVIYAHPKGIGAKYANRDDLDHDIARVRAKTAGRQIVRIRGGALPEIVDEAEQELIRGDPAIFQRGSLIVRPGLTKIAVPGEREVVGTRLVPVKVHHMVERFSRVIDFQRFDARSGTWVSVNCPKEIADTYLEREGQWRLPVLTGVISAPTLRADGSVLDQEGYDEATGLLFDAHGVAFPAVPLSPSRHDGVAALSELKALINTFPFLEEASRSVALSAILTAIVRPSLPSAPLHAFTAPTAGSGKSLLVDIASMIATGRETPVMAQGHTAEEFEKRLGAALIAGDPTISIDNCEQPIGGELLCQVLTQPSVNVRLLGQSKNVEVLTNSAFFATGNNLRVFGDMTRRTIVCSLDPGCERPELRDFRDNPLDRIRRERSRFVIAALTFLRAFVAAGRPSQTRPLGSFETWSKWVRDALIWAGDIDPCLTMERARSVDPQLELLRSVIHHWGQTIGDRRLSAADIVEFADNIALSSFDHKLGGLREALMAVAARGSSIDTRRLGIWLGRNKDRIVEGAKIVSAGIVGGFTQWQLVRVTGLNVPAKGANEREMLRDVA